MPIEHINKTDTLNEGREKLNAAIDGANSADITSQEADTKAAQALANSESTQTQLDTIVIEGDSSVEAAQARVDEKGESHATLKARIDDGMNSVNTQLAQIMVNVKSPPPPLLSVVGDNVHNDIPIINSVIDYVSNKGGGVVYIPNGRYFHGSQLFIKDNVVLMGDTNTILDSKDLSSLTQITTPSITPTDLTLNVNIIKGDKTIHVNNSLKSGDFVEIASYKRFTEEWDEGTEIRPHYTMGELLEVEYATPTQITFTESISFDFNITDVNYIRGYTPTKKIGIKNIQLKRDYRESGHSQGIRISKASNFEISNVDIEHTNADGIIVERSLLGYIEKITGRGGSDSLGLNYLVDLNTGCKNIIVDKVHGNGYRHVTAAGGSGLTSMNNSLYNISGENTSITTIDTHANTMNYLYENCNLDYGLNISGKGHTIRNIKSKSGHFRFTEGGINNTFENIDFEECFTIFVVNGSTIDYTFRNITIVIGVLTARVSFGLKPRGHTFDNFKLINNDIRKALNNNEADSKFSKGMEVGFLVGDNYKVNNLTIEGFPIGLDVVGANASIKGINLVNCGWVTSKFGVQNTVIRTSTSAKNAIMDGLSIACTNDNLDLSSSRLFTFGEHPDIIRIPLTILNVQDGIHHINNYMYGLVGGLDNTFFMQNVRPTVTQGALSFNGIGKFIYNTVIEDSLS